MRAKKLVFVFVLPLLFGFASDKNSLNSGDTPVALVKKIVKNVMYAKINQNLWEEAKTGLPLNSGEQVKTGPKSIALILFTDGSGLLNVRENSILTINSKLDNKRLNKDTFIEKGTVSFDVKKQEDEEFKFTTPTAVASIRGTKGLFDVLDDGESKMILESGSVELLGKSGKKVTLTAGNTVVFDKAGNANLYPSTDADKKKLGQAKSLSTKKVKIQTAFGIVEVEYFPDED